jgi:hypothetical protein
MDGEMMEGKNEDNSKQPWRVIITKADNGYILENPYAEYGDDTFQFKVIESDEYSDDESKEEAEASQKLCWAMLEFFGYYPSKHNKYRLNIEVEKQHEDE